VPESAARDVGPLEEVREGDAEYQATSTRTYNVDGGVEGDFAKAAGLEDVHIVVEGESLDVERQFGG
jgi:hypothetical protein